MVDNLSQRSRVAHIPASTETTCAPQRSPNYPALGNLSGTAPLDERAVFTAVVYLLTSGCAWRYLPGTFGVSPATAHRRFTAWTEAGLCRRLHRAVLDEFGARGELDWTSAIVGAASVRAKGGLADRPNPVDLDKKGSKLHVLSEAQGLPLAVAVSGANTHDSLALEPLVHGTPAIRSRRGPPSRPVNPQVSDPFEPVR